MKQPVYLEINLYNKRSRPAGLLRSLPKPYTEFELLWLIKNAAKDKKLSGLILNTSGFSADRAFLWELKNVLEEFGAAGKKVITYFEEADIDLYCVLSAASAKIVMNGTGSLSFIGYTAGRIYLKETLDKVGAGFRELKFLDYKTSNEMWSRTDMSDADREQYNAYLDDIFGLTKETIMKARGFDEEKFLSLLNNDFFISPKLALEKGLVDALGREDAINEMLSDGKISPTYKVWGNTSLMTRGRHTPHYDPPAVRFNKAEIALVTAKGNTDMEEGMAIRSLARTIHEAAERRSVKALVIRIDSPGGSAIAADYIAQAVETIKKDKPVVVTFGQVAASGGYWAAMNANHITTSPYSLTGSIGVISGWFFDRTLNEKLGVNVNTLARGDHADLMSGFILPSRDLSTEEETQFRRLILQMYDEFVRKAAKGRGMTFEELEPLARGRIYSGISALNFKLADSLGGYLEALQTARKLANIPDKKRLVIHEYPRPKFLESLAARYLSASVKTLIESSALPFLNVKELNNIRDDLSYRVVNNGKVMPILPLGFSF